MISNLFQRREVMTIPACISPWVYAGAHWGAYGVCCNSYGMDFGKLTDVDSMKDFNKEVFNAPSYLSMRKSLVDGKLNEYCGRCPSKMYGSCGMHQIVNQYTDALLQIEDDEQRRRARANFAKGIDAAYLGKIEVEHNPSFLNINCGSACNIRCKFCYNCLMDYNPDPRTILKLVDLVHEDLIFAQLTGGEPLITKAGRMLLEELGKRKYKFGVRLGTNAQWTDFDILRPLNLVEVQISADGATKEVYENVRIGGDFEDLISNIKKFRDFRNERPNMVIRLNYTITSDNYMDVPEAVKLYEDLGMFITFNLVMREKDDPQNIKERVDLYEPLLKAVDKAIALTGNAFTKDCLINVKEEIAGRMKKRSL